MNNGERKRRTPEQKKLQTANAVLTRTLQKKRRKFIANCMIQLEQAAITELSALSDSKDIEKFNEVMSKLNLAKQLIAAYSFSVEELISLAKSNSKIFKSIMELSISHIGQILGKKDSETPASRVIVNFMNLQKEITQDIETAIKEITPVKPIYQIEECKFDPIASGKGEVLL